MSEEVQNGNACVVTPSCLIIEHMTFKDKKIVIRRRVINIWRFFKLFIFLLISEGNSTKFAWKKGRKTKNIQPQVYSTSPYFTVPFLLLQRQNFWNTIPVFNLEVYLELFQTCMMEYSCEKNIMDFSC